MGIDLQLRGREVSVEVSAARPLSGESYVRRAFAGKRDFRRSAPSSAGPGRGGFREAQRSHAHTAALVCTHGAQASVSLRDGGWANAAAEFLRGAGPHAVPRTTLAKALARPGDGRHPAAAVDWRSGGESGGDVDGQGAGKFELHGVQ